MSYKRNQPKSATNRCQLKKCADPDCADFDILPPLNLRSSTSDYNKSFSGECVDPSSQWSEREWMLSRELAEAETKLECLKEKLNIVSEERNRLLEENAIMNENIKHADEELEEVKKELREYKYKEVRLLSYYNVLEEENANLHKQLSDVRKAQVDSEIKSRQEIECAKRKKLCRKSSENINAQDIELLEEEVARMKILTITKGEQLTTLREVLNTTKKTCEESTKNMKAKFEAEKNALLKEIKDLKNEVKMLRDKSGNGILENDKQQYQDLLRQVEDGEKEKRTLMQMLFTAQEQKLTLTRKLENQSKNKSKRHCFG